MLGDRAHDVAVANESDHMVVVVDHRQAAYSSIDEAFRHILERRLRRARIGVALHNRSDRYRFHVYASLLFERTFTMANTSVAAPTSAQIP